MQKKRALVVDDDSNSRAVLKDFLESIGFQTVEAVDGEDALRKFSLDAFEIVLSDIYMPNMNGLDLLKRIREQDKNVIVLIITGFPTIEGAIQAVRDGAYDYITKPFQFDDLQIKIDRAVQSRRMDNALKKFSGIMWALIVSIPVWIILGILLGIVWKWF